MSEITQPFTPKQAKKNQEKSIPNEVFEALNGMLSEKYSKRGINIKYKTLREKIYELNPELKEDFKEHWLDIEDLYRRSGWEVMTDNPAYNETYDGFYTFTPKKNK